MAPGVSLGVSPMCSLYTPSPMTRVSPPARHAIPALTVRLAVAGFCACGQVWLSLPVVAT